ncbi:MAG: hypothetical protein LBI04_06030, partial [Treponema sp.]|nr:hypothetical protein [Treponema sp.]
MSAIQTLIHRISLKRSLYTQVLFTVFAFLLMVVLSYAFVNRITQNDLVRNTENILDFVENQINSDLTETQVILGGFAQTMRNMVMYGDDAEKIQKYIYSLSNYIHSREKNAVNPNGLYCYIEKEPYGHAVLCSVDTVLPQGYSLLDRPWYRTAVEAGGNIIETLPYRDAVTGNLIITYSCSIYDDEGGYLGVVCIDVQIDYIGDKVLHTALTKDGYGFLVAQDLTLLTHPNPDFVGLKMSEPGIPLSVLVDDMVSQEKVSEAPLINWKGESSIAFIRKFPNGWYLGLLALRDLYYQNAKNMALILSILGTALAAVLIIVLIRVDAAKNKSDMESRHKTAFLARVSHDIRTPMNAILGITEIQLQDKTLPQSAVEAFAKINNSGDLLIGLINDILDMSKIEAGKLELIPVQYDVPSLINDTVQLNILRFESKPIEFKLFVDENIPLSLIGDELRIKQILNNLLSNAFKYTERGIVSLAVTVDYTPQGESGSVLT